MGDPDVKKFIISAFKEDFCGKTNPFNIFWSINKLWLDLYIFHLRFAKKSFSFDVIVLICIELILNLQKLLIFKEYLYRLCI